MKKLLPWTLLCLIQTTYAGEQYRQPSQNTQAIAVSEAYANAHSSVSNSVTNGNAQTINLNADNAQEASAAIAPNPSNYVKCPIITQDTKAFSVFFAGMSGTTGVSVNGICYAMERNDWETADKMMCKLDKIYAESNKNCAR